MLKDEVTEQDMLFAHTYFLTLFLTVAVVLFNIVYGSPLVFYLPFVTGSFGSLLLYIFLISAHAHDSELQNLKFRAKIVCHSFCCTAYIIGAFCMLVFYDFGFIISWSYHIWVVPVLMVATLQPKHNAPLFILFFSIGLALTVLELYGIFGAIIQSMAMGGFWGLSFYFLLGFWSDIKIKPD